jgi:pyruvate/2-oxoglutarate dehydrogenase complex dihydrolipoamide dehydrogenase (E3) component
MRPHSLRREAIDRLGVAIYEQAGTARFVDPHTIETASGLRLQADKIILCAGSTSRRLAVPGFELTATHSDAWSLTAVPPSMLVVGGGATGVQVASIFNAFGARIQLFQAGPRILPSEDEDVSAAVAAAFRESGIVVRESFGTIESFEQTPSGVRMVLSKDGTRDSAEAALVVVAVGWVADTAGLSLATAGVDEACDALRPGGIKMPTSKGLKNGSGQFTIPQRPIRRCLQDLPAFVVNRGGEYCFIPGLRALRWLSGA